MGNYHVLRLDAEVERCCFPLLNNLVDFARKLDVAPGHHPFSEILKINYF